LEELNCRKQKRVIFDFYLQHQNPCRLDPEVQEKRKYCILEGTTLFLGYSYEGCVLERNGKELKHTFVIE
jgi:hypothetical protein